MTREQLLHVYEETEADIDDIEHALQRLDWQPAANQVWLKVRNQNRIGRVSAGVLESALMMKKSDLVSKLACIARALQEGDYEQ